MIPLPKVNQTYVIKNKDGKVLRRNRILAAHPGGGYIIQSKYYGRIAGSLHQIVHTQLLNIEKAFELEHDVCNHGGNWLEAYVDMSGYAPPMPNFYECEKCHDRFPVTGDTSYWFPKVLNDT